MIERRTRAWSRYSGDFAVDLRPARSTRGAVLWSGWLLLLAGFGLILHLPLPAALRLPLAAAWLVTAGRSIARQARAYRDVRTLRLGRNRAGVAFGTAGPRRIRVLAGSVLVHRVAWLRLELGPGAVYGELILAADVGAVAWRRLACLWRYGLRT